MTDEEVDKLRAEALRAENAYGSGFWRAAVLKLTDKLIADRAGSGGENHDGL